MDKITTVTGTAVPLERSNVDTDQIIPAEFLKRVTKTGFDDALFYAWRQDPEFVLNRDHRFLERLDVGRDHVGARRGSGTVLGGDCAEGSALAAGELRGGLSGVDDQLVVDGEDPVLVRESSSSGLDADGRIVGLHQHRRDGLQRLRREGIGW